ncbi:VRR-NUC domain-containing protein [Streptococcus suis]|uniref:VRR-NUC domain-containing protein n=1 Tax=Streptococcus suis TaxID=1307 RepID=UPI001EE7BF12|nr:VRR-NUC domain-containing protein [Streptococcus suis]MBS8086494.1 VRR-NUC domain-containing protein [Streptococcus suis]MDG3144571.1 VRR-NUC domain-containing protein [Streptococcus suis]MDG3162110.1 VRR-NUC domain-containing protein [Streptococcus suis]MDG3241179.1 VRR-NUC domain-containing protein [Streptococcus suis]HEM5047485.1 VRR-NUC domain-containing protein [Streptococcus suis]
MREKYVEQALVKSVKARGGICPKWVSPSFSGVPDRLVFLPNGKFGLVEVKAPDQKPRMLQVSRHKLFERLGFKVYVIDHIEMIGEVLDEIDIT